MSSANDRSPKISLVYLVFNTIFNLLTAEDQIRCFGKMPHGTRIAGHFIVETAPAACVDRPDRLIMFTPKWWAKARSKGDVARYDPVTQLPEENHVQPDRAGDHHGADRLSPDPRRNGPYGTDRDCGRSTGLW